MINRTREMAYGPDALAREHDRRAKNMRDTVRPLVGDSVQLSPLTGPFETHLQARVWTLVAPDGRTLVVRNLRKFLRDNPDVCENPESFCSRMKQIARAYRRGDTVRASRLTCYGWRLLCESSVPNDSQAIMDRARERTARINRARERKKQ